MCVCVCIGVTQALQAASLEGGEEQKTDEDKKFHSLTMGEVGVGERE